MAPFRSRAFLGFPTAPLEASESFKSESQPAVSMARVQSWLRRNRSEICSRRSGARISAQYKSHVPVHWKIDQFTHHKITQTEQGCLAHLESRLAKKGP